MKDLFKMLAVAVCVCAMCGTTALAAGGMTVIEPFDEETVQDAEAPQEDTRHITILIVDEADPEPEENVSAASNGVMLSATDQNMLLRIAMAEAEDQDTKGMALVMRVVLNRVASREFPDTVEGVIFQENQFEPVSNGRYDKVTPDARCYEALDMVMNGWDESEGAEYFCMDYATTKWHDRNLTKLFQYKDHVFYR